MKLAIVADLHFRGKSLSDKKKAWGQAVDKIIKLKAGLMVLVGDVFDTRNIGGREASMGTVYRAFMDGIDRLIRANVKIIVIEGNHELATGDQLSALEPIKRYGSLIVVPEDKGHVDVKDKLDGVVDGWGHANLAIGYIPWKSEQDRSDVKRHFSSIKKMFKVLENEEEVDYYKLVVGHITVKGAVLNSGISLMGTEFEVDPAQLEDLGADMVALGHIHKRQQIGEKIHYVGALSQNNFGEEGNPSGFMIIDTEKRTHKFVEIDAPKYVTITDGELEKELNQSNYVKARFKEKPSAETMEALKDCENLTIEIVPERETVTRKVEGVEAGRSDEDLLDAYLKSKGKGEVDRQRIIKAAKELAEGIK